MIKCLDLGFIPYEEASLWQKKLSQKRQDGELEDTLLLLEHPPIYTMGKRDATSDFLLSADDIHEKGILIEKTDRGGRVTYHGPGQLVGYLIFKLKEGIPSFVHKIESVIIQVLADYHVKGERDAEYPGVWVGKEKVAALGLHIEHHVSTHGFSLNVNCDLAPYEWIKACGIQGRGVTSLCQLLGWTPEMLEVKQRVSQAMASVFGTEVVIEGSDQGLNME